MRRTYALILAACLMLAAVASSRAAPVEPSGILSLAEPGTPSESPEQIQELGIMSHSAWTHQVDPAGALGEGYRSSYVGYDRDGNLVEQASYDPNGTALVEIVNTYDQAGLVIESVGREHSGVDARTVFDYDGERITATTSYRPDGSLLVASQFEYDSSDRIIATQTQVPDAGESQRTVFEYDDDLGVVRAAAHDSRGSVLAQSETLQDGEGRPIESTAFLQDGSVASIARYTYDADGQLLEAVVEDADGTVLQRNTRAYDADGRVIEITQSNPAADLEHRVALEYAEDGTLAVERTYNKLGELVTEVRHVYEYYDDEPDQSGD